MVIDIGPHLQEVIDNVCMDLTVVTILYFLCRS